MLASIVIRTLNEAKYLGELLECIARQQTEGFEWEVILVDSGSTDGTLEIAQTHGCKIQYITKEEFSFGRSLNFGCEAAKGDFLVLISGHCVPMDTTWLQALCQPLIDLEAVYSYGRQVCGQESYYSECRIFAKYYPEQSRIPQDGFFCNNANSALIRSSWQQHHFDEELTGLEDMELALRITKEGGRIAYVAEAAVFHLHNENWATIERRFEREAIALQGILPHVSIGKRDFVRYVFLSIWMDWCSAWKDKLPAAKFWEILRYRTIQYLGSYKGNNDHRRLSRRDKEVYFYPSSTPSLTNPPVVNRDVSGQSLEEDILDESADKRNVVSN